MPSEYGGDRSSGGREQTKKEQGSMFTTNQVDIIEFA